MGLRSVALLLLAVALCSPLLAQSPEGTAAPASTEYLREAARGVSTLQGWYSQTTGLYRTTSWWNAANAVTVLANYSRLAHTRRYYPVFANTLKQASAKYPGFLNRYYDDEGWWALAWIDVYDLTRDARYLRTAQAIFGDMTGGWDATCGGGVWWSKDRAYKNAIANELFLSVAAELALRSRGAARSGYVEWSRKEWAWFKNSGMINSRNLVNDGLVTATCENNGKTTWTYNQGVILGGLAALHAAAPDASLLPQAATIADAAMASLSDHDGVLHDSCEPACGGDGEQFKGILLRNLMALEAADPMPAYQRFAETNAQSIWRHAQGPGYQLDQVWSGPFRITDAAIESSAIDALLAAASMAQ